MRRRDFILAFGGCGFAFRLRAHAQQPATPVIGFLSSGSSDAYAPYVAGFQLGLKESGFSPGQNVSIEYRWAQGHYDRLAALATDLAQRQVTVIVASGGPPPAVAAKAASSTIPIIFSSIDDPVELGLVASLNRPGGNATGMSLFRFELVTKQLELIRELAPKSTATAVLVNPTQSNTNRYLADIQQGAQRLRHELRILNASTETELDVALATLRGPQNALLVTPDTLFNTQRDRLIARANQNGVPIISQFREFTTAGALASYGANVVDVYRQIGLYTARILKGAKPNELPVMRPTKFELVINLRTAKIIGLEVPPILLARADEVIE